MACSEDCQQVWTELEWLVLSPEERANGCPPDTRQLPYMARARGMAAHPVIGTEAEVSTASGRRIRGRVRELEPGYEHTFGHPLPQWVHMKNHIRELVASRSAPPGER
jgi:2-amino-4-ketopentanoate thiolase alpha subunit